MGRRKKGGKIVDFCMLSTADAEVIHGRGGREEKMHKEYISGEIRVDILDYHRNQEVQRRMRRETSVLGA